MLSGATLSDFVSQLSQRPIAHPNRYSVHIVGCQGMQDRNIDMMCNSITMPGVNMRSVMDEIRTGPIREQAQGVTYGPITCNFIMTDGMEQKLYFQEWMKEVVNTSSVLGEGTFEVGFYKDYIGEIEITQLDRSMGPSYGMRLYEAWPKTMNPQEWGWDQNDTFQTLAIEFAFHHWEYDVGLGTNLSDTSMVP